MSPLIQLDAITKVFSTDEVETHDRRFAGAAQRTVQLFDGKTVAEACPAVAASTIPEPELAPLC